MDPRKVGYQPRPGYRVQAAGTHRDKMGLWGGMMDRCWPVAVRYFVEQDRLTFFLDVPLDRRPLTTVLRLTDELSVPLTAVEVEGDRVPLVAAVLDTDQRANILVAQGGLAEAIVTVLQDLFGLLVAEVGTDRVSDFVVAKMAEHPEMYDIDRMHAELTWAIREGVTPKM